MDDKKTPQNPPKNPPKKTADRTKTDALGQNVPISIIKPEILKQDAIVSKTINRVKKLQERIISDKARLFEDVELFLQEIAKKNGLSWKGNAILNSFDGKYRVEIRFKEHIQFGIELQLAKQKIDECLKAWSADSNVNLRAIITEAFQVDKKGEIAKHRILALRKYNIKDAKWKEAMELIDKAIRVVSTKQYVSFYERDEYGEYKQIILNFTAL
ncbi:MAG: DUF3164 family protein [Candidatus Cloacimonetes bacterium]|jgi:hypothetical protein|nr:DUF3164 family protein [Candidatus Cloacimonadota bacterium]MCB5260141.1 DUF3164 family protein [Candidatus Cloacimonadota bacterium]